jgi:hypothetical protein
VKTGSLLYRDICIDGDIDDLQPPHAQTAEDFQNTLKAGGNPVNITVRLS